jgi:hypothetical protein
LQWNIPEVSHIFPNIDSPASNYLVGWPCEWPPLGGIQVKHERLESMWGWKSVERLVEPSVSFERGKGVLQEQGFRLHASNPTHAVFKSAGSENPWTTLAPDGENVPIDLALATSPGGLYLQFRYETFCLFDTGDLERFADEIATLLSPTETPV